MSLLNWNANMLSFAVQFAVVLAQGRQCFSFREVAALAAGGLPEAVARMRAAAAPAPPAVDETAARWLRARARDAEEVRVCWHYQPNLPNLQILIFANF